jgi:sodium bicarbonate cotransporter 7
MMAFILQKSFGYHLDLFVIAITVGINSLLGIPWFVAATVLSVNNVLSLKKTSESNVPGEKPKLACIT